MITEEFFANANPEQKKIQDFIDLQLAMDFGFDDIDSLILDRYYADDVSYFYALAYLTYLKGKTPELEKGEKEENVQSAQDNKQNSKQESIHLDDYEKLIDKFLNGETAPFDPFDGSTIFEHPAIGNYELLCSVGDSAERIPVLGMVPSITANPDSFIHIDLIPKKILRNKSLMVLVSINGDYGFPLSTRWAKNTIRKSLDSNKHLRIKPFQFADLFDDDKKLNDKAAKAIEITVYEDAKQVGIYEIPIVWPKEDQNKHIPFTHRKEVSDFFEELSRQVGWDNFKKHIYSLSDCGQIRYLRKESDLPYEMYSKHTVIAGNPGTGKKSAAKYLTSIYKMLGLLTSDHIHYVSATKLMSATSDFAVEEEFTDAAGSTLVMYNAHELYKAERDFRDRGDKVVRYLIDAMNSTKYDAVEMVILLGEKDGMEALMANYPELARCIGSFITLEDFTPEQLLKIAERYCMENKYVLTPDATAKLDMFIQREYSLRGSNFQNAHFIKQTFTERILPCMSARLVNKGQTPLDQLGEEQLTTIIADDIPSIIDEPDAGFEELDNLIGLGKVKSKMKDFLNAINLAAKRMQQGLPATMPRLHMAFLGNPGTGKTTVAQIVGKLFASWGILSGGNVITAEKSQMVGQYIGETEYKMRNLLERARGNILFIDEAYQLVEGGEKDYGRIVMNSLLTELGKEHQNMVVILAGYTAPMKQLLKSNEGVESRFPNVFVFDDYTTEELMEIGKKMLSKQGFQMDEKAEENMRTIITNSTSIPSARFGNGRFVSNLIQNEILASMGARLMKLPNPTAEDLTHILPEDVQVHREQQQVVFDDIAIDAALKRLDNLVGMDGVKKAIGSFVETSRYLHSIGEPYVGKGLLSWRFIGKSGTGKSTVAEIMACILHGMHLISNNRVTEVKGERIFTVSETDRYAVLEEAVKKSCNGLIFIDVDDKIFRDTDYNYGRSIEQVRLKVEELTSEVGGEGALILAELDAPNKDVAEQLVDAGVFEFDHTLLFNDFSSEELFSILAGCLQKYNVHFSAAAKKHILLYLKQMRSSVEANARTMKLMARAIYQQVILRESKLSRHPSAHSVQLSDIENFKWNGRKGRIGF